MFLFLVSPVVLSFFLFGVSLFQLTAPTCREGATQIILFFPQILPNNEIFWYHEYRRIIKGVDGMSTEKKKELKYDQTIKNTDDSGLSKKCVCFQRSP